VLLIPVANLPPVGTGGKFAAGINDTGGKFATGVNDTGGSELEGKNVYMCYLYYPKVSQQNY
jgi:hypothetical protein